MAYSFFHMWTYNQSTLAKRPLLANQNRASFTFKWRFRLWRLFYQRLLQIFLRKKTLDLCQLAAAQTCLYGIKKNKNTSSKSQRDVSLLKRDLVSRNELREIQNIGARDVNVFIANFLLQVREFLFLICV